MTNQKLYYGCSIIEEFLDYKDLYIYWFNKGYGEWKDSQCEGLIKDYNKLCFPCRRKAREYLNELFSLEEVKRLGGYLSAVYGHRFVVKGTPLPLDMQCDWAETGGERFWCNKFEAMRTKLYGFPCMDLGDYGYGDFPFEVTGFITCYGDNPEYEEELFWNELLSIQ